VTLAITSAQFIKGITGDDSILRDGRPHIACIGRSNVGKSSLINALLGRRELVKTGKKPGKTTEINFFLINNSFYFVDLPGYGYAKVTTDKKEIIRDMILWYLGEGRPAKTTIMLIIDVKVGLTTFDEEALAVIREEGLPYVLVANKIDSLNQKELAAQTKLIREQSHEHDIAFVSAEKRIGTAALLETLCS
jgi:GTP-binding protein